MSSYARVSWLAHVCLLAILACPNVVHDEVSPFLGIVFQGFPSPEALTISALASGEVVRTLNPKPQTARIHHSLLLPLAKIAVSATPFRVKA